MLSIEKVYIKNFKSYKNYTLSLDKNFKHIVVYGNNGVGKTNLLDGISYFSNRKGLRGSNLDEVLPNDRLNEVDTHFKIKIKSLDNIFNLTFKIINEDNKLKKYYSLLDTSKDINLKSINKELNIMNIALCAEESLKKNKKQKIKLCKFN